MGPVLFGAGRSARRGGGLRGSCGLRITAWVLCGLAMSNALSLIGRGILVYDVAPWQIAITLGYQRNRNPWWAILFSRMSPPQRYDARMVTPLEAFQEPPRIRVNSSPVIQALPSEGASV